MIERTSAFKTTDGETHASLEAAKLHELKLLVADPVTDQEEKLAKFFAVEIIKNADRILDILSTTATSKPKARKINGGTKKRAPKNVVTPEV